MLEVKLLEYLTRGDGLQILARLLAKGMDPNDQDGGGCSAITRCIDSMSWGWSHSSFDPWSRDRKSRKIDTEDTRDKMKAIHLLAKHGAKWLPKGKAETESARRSFLRLTSDYTVEFVWIMSKYRACRHDDVVELLRTPSIRSHTATHRARLNELLDAWPSLVPESAESSRDNGDSDPR